MRIIYGVAGEGLGHSSRARAIIEHLQEQGHKVLILAYGIAYKVLKKDFEVIKIEGIRFKFRKQRLSLRGTIKKSIPYIIKNIRTAGLRNKKIERFSPDLAITDFEPVTALLSYKYNLPLISIDNQHRLTFLKLDVPPKYLRNYLLAKYAIQVYIPKADFFIVLSFTAQKSRKKKVFFVSPILRKEVLKVKQKKGEHIIVYMNQPYKTLIKTLKTINEKFIIYGYNKAKRERNIFFRKNRKKFLKDLASAKAVISTAGFTLMSESLFLKKPLFAIPLKGQFEQALNALFLKKAGLGDFSEKPSHQQIQKFIENLSKYRKALNDYKIDSNQTIKVLDKIINNLK